MAIRVIRLGTPRARGEGLHRDRSAAAARRSKNAFRVEELVRRLVPDAGAEPRSHELGRHASNDAQWQRFVKKYRQEMAEPHASHAVEFLAVLSHKVNFSVGCYCENESRCHRSVLRALLAGRGADIVKGA